MSLFPPYSHKKEKPWGYEIVFTPPNLSRVGKILFIKKGCRLSLQYHTLKEETLCLFSGKAKIWQEDKDQKIKPLYMEPQMGYTIMRRQKHRIEALEDSFIFEISSPERGKTIRLEDDYGRGEEKLG
ncbi:cupin [Candidatus Shapirobacteria bacterium]|nr:cupin [Candidatus Shapirobacteria bacterium]